MSDEFEFRILRDDSLVWAFGPPEWRDQELAPGIAELIRNDPELASFNFLIDLRGTTGIDPVEYPPDRWVGILRSSGASLSGIRHAFVGSDETELGSLSLSKPLAAAWLELELEFFRSIPQALAWLGREGLDEARWPDPPARGAQAPVSDPKRP